MHWEAALFCSLRSHDSRVLLDVQRYFGFTSCISYIVKRRVENPSFLDEKLLCGFGYPRAYKTRHVTRLDGNQIVRLCATLYQRVRRTVKKAADLLQSHRNNTDTAITESTYL